MVTYSEAPRKRYGLLVLAVILLVFAGVCLFAGGHNRSIRGLGLTATMASVALVKLGVGLPSGRNQTSGPGAQNSPGRRLLWILSIALVPVVIGAWLLLQRDASNGGHQVWPVDVFAGVGLVCAVVWSLLLARLAR